MTMRYETPGASKIAEGGTVEVELFLLDSTVAAHIERYELLTNTAGAGTTFALYFNSTDNRFRRNYTENGDDNTWEGSPPLYVPPGTRVLAVWSGTSAGDVCQFAGQIVTGTPDELAARRAG